MYEDGGSVGLLSLLEELHSVNEGSFVLSLILDIPNETTSENSESKEQKAESACRTHGIKEQATGAVAAADKQVSASKTRNRTGRKIKAKK